MPSKSIAAAAVLVALVHAGVADAYVDLAPTLGKIAGDSKAIALVEVTAVDAATHTITLRPLRTIKGDVSADPIRNRVAPADGETPRPIRQWAEPGARGVWFATKSTALVCFGPAWYQVKLGGGEWKLGVERPDLPLAYCGTVTRLADAVTAMLAGKPAVLTTVVYGATDVDTSFDLALGRNTLPGLAKVQRVRGSLTMPAMVLGAASQPGYVIGPGPVDTADLPALLRSLQSPEAGVRAEAAEDVGWLGGTGASAASRLSELLKDDAVAVRLSAATALLRVGQNTPEATGVLGASLAAANATERRDAATAVALAGPPAASLTPALVGLLKDADASVRFAALQAITTIGPAVSPDDAPAAVAAVTPMLDDTAERADAADALGRLGAAARPVPAALVTMLADPQPPVRWAAVRAMAQIGGAEAKPAVDFITKALPGASEVEQYNMMIYLSLLGPVARDAAETLRTTRLKNPVLPSATLWAIGDPTVLPWQMPDRRGFGGPGGGPGGGFGGGPGGGFGGGPGGGGGPGDINRYMYAAYVRELGVRLKPAAEALTAKLLDGTAGDVPEWGYAILTADPDGVVATLTPKLADADRTVRERAAVALGHLGAAAVTARPSVDAAVVHASDARERKLMEWCRRALNADAKV